MQIIRATDRTSLCTLALRYMYMPRCAFPFVRWVPFALAPLQRGTTAVAHTSLLVRDARSVSFVAVFRAHVRTVDVEKLLRRRRSPPLPENASDHECCEVWGGGDAIRDAVLITRTLSRVVARARARISSVSPQRVATMESLWGRRVQFRRGGRADQRLRPAPLRRRRRRRRRGQGGARRGGRRVAPAADDRGDERRRVGRRV